MASTDIGVSSSARPSSRVLKPPGGGHSNIFAEPEVLVNAPRPKYNQQNSSSVNACMGSTDPNQVVEKLREELQQPKPNNETNAVKAENNNKMQQTTTTATTKPITTETESVSSSSSSSGNGKPNDNANNSSQRGRVPPGGFSSGGFW